MFFEFDAQTPANTAETSSIKTTMRLNAGIIHFVEFVFPNGCAGLAHARVKKGGVQLYPRNQTGSVKGDLFPVRFNEVQELRPGDNTLTLETWNEDTDFSHTITCRIGLLRKEELFPEVSLADLIRLFFRSFRRRT